MAGRRVLPVSVVQDGTGLDADIQAQRGFSMITDMFAPAMASMSAPVRVRGNTLGVVTIAGPAVRLTEERMESLAGALLTTAEEIADASPASQIFRSLNS